MNVRRESIPWILVSGFLFLVSYVGWLYTGWTSSLVLFVIFSIFTVFLVYFFRDPDRVPNSSAEDAWLAPADGVVTRLDDYEDGRTLIVIFLTVFNVHVNRMPVDGRIEGIEYRSGRFLPAFAGDLEQKNEQNRLTCRDSRGRLFELRQIAGLLARRIYCWKKSDESFRRGERFGMIALSSRTDIVLPSDVTVTVSSGDTVRGGQTVIGRG